MHGQSDSTAVDLDYPFEKTRERVWIEFNGSCNGLVYITVPDFMMYLWNPATRKSMKLPDIKMPNILYINTCGIGYDNCIDDYKVVVFLGVDVDTFIQERVEVYTLRTHSWRRIGDCPHSLQVTDSGKFLTVEAVKEKMWKKCGTSVNSMGLELYDEMGAKVSELSDNSRPLGFYSPQDGYRLQVIDFDPSSVTSGGWLEDTSLVEKYKISEEAYDKLDGKYQTITWRNSVQKSRLVELNGDRCQVEPGEKRGVVKFVGQAEILGPGFWIGVQYDEPLGKHDGMVKGTRFFDCPPLHGAMVRPDKVQVGDYPERDPFEEEEI
ncbi:hypothetical protein RHGRI_014886 [Rhododendron griersonianum]|uniref:CAP-Gly domain-containing protein n=1 Tax=Rhododendron griersonianum TaxID=479676 RepID=A0AAV6KB64_9ERIC|nr:hypothetical protein RHGRI_014886 [Rhododendron griersonianum]